jgi:hypothetical protein
MLTLRSRDQRGHANHGWLDTYHTFSFADYHDPAHMGFSVLRVINDDRVAAGAGFGMHPHRDMEIVTVVLDGTLEHRDSMGNVAQIKPGEVQRMSAGTGVLHSEYNPSKTEPVHLLQIWLLPAKEGVTPSYEQKNFPRAERLGAFRLVAAPDGAEGAVSINQDARLYLAALEPGQAATLSLKPGRKAFVHVATGKVRLNGQPLEGGDGARLQDEREVRLEGLDAADVLVFDLP